MTLTDSQSMRLTSIEKALQSMEKRMASIDGNGFDKRGGRLGRLEDMIYWGLAVLLMTLISSVGTLAMMVMALKK